MKILVVDDHPLLRTAVATAISSGIEGSEVIESSTIAESVSALADDSVDVVALDLRLDGESGLDVARHITNKGLRARCVVFTSVGTPQAKIAAFETASVAAFLEKSYDSGPLIDAILAAGKGFSSLTLSEVQAAATEIRSSGVFDPSLLTAREQEIAELVADGNSDAEIAEILFLAASTVRNHLTSIYTKIGVESRTRLTALVWEARNKSDGI